MGSYHSSKYRTCSILISRMFSLSLSFSLRVYFWSTWSFLWFNLSKSFFSFSHVTQLLQPQFSTILFETYRFCRPEIRITQVMNLALNVQSEPWIPNFQKDLAAGVHAFPGFGSWMTPIHPLVDAYPLGWCYGEGVKPSGDGTQGLALMTLWSLLLLCPILLPWCAVSSQAKKVGPSNASQSKAFLFQVS